MNYLVIIPARANSKRIPNKNLVTFNGIPLIVHTINYALKFFNIEKIWVNTDSEDISKLALKYGVNVFNRSHSLATDFSSTADVLKNHIESMPKVSKDIDAVILLQPTNPLRPHNLIKQAIDCFESSESLSLASFSMSNRKFGKIEQNKFIPTNYTFGQRTQDMDKLYFENGLIYITKISEILKGRIISEDTYPLIIDGIEGQIDIDTYDDLVYADFVYKNMING